MNFPTGKIYQQEKEKENVDFAAILTGEVKEVPDIEILDTGLATFQSINNKDEEYDLKYSVKVTAMDKIKEVYIEIGKPTDKERE